MCTKFNGILIIFYAYLVCKHEHIRGRVLRIILNTYDELLNLYYTKQKSVVWKK